MQGSRVAPREIVLQKKTQRPVQFEITEQTRDAVASWIAAAHLTSRQFLFPSRVSMSPHISTRQYSRIVGSWVAAIGMDPAAYGTHSLRRTKATLIYRRTKNLRAVQLLLGHTKLESTVRYLGIEVEMLWRLRSRPGVASHEPRPLEATVAVRPEAASRGDEPCHHQVAAAHLEDHAPLQLGEERHAQSFPTAGPHSKSSSPSGRQSDGQPFSRQYATKPYRVSISFVRGSASSGRATGVATYR